MPEAAGGAPDSIRSSLGSLQAAEVARYPPNGHGPRRRLIGATARRLAAAGTPRGAAVDWAADVMRDPLESDICSKYLRAVADPERLRIVQCLRTGAKSVGEIARHLNAPIVNASHHLKHLRRAGLVSTERQGRFVFYTLAPRFAPAGTGGGTLNVLDFGCCRIELGRGPERRR